MKVLYIHQHFSTPKNGGGIRSYEMAKSLMEHGHSVTMICGGGANLKLDKTDDPYVTRGQVDGINIIQIMAPYSNSDGLLKRTKSFCQYALKSIKFVRKEDFDLIFSTSTPLTAGIPGIYAKWFKKKPFVFEVRDLWPELPKALGLKNPFFISAMSLLEYLSYHNADGCIGLSPGICEGIKKRSQKEKPITMIPNGCDLAIFNRDKRSNLNVDGVGNEDTVAIFTGAHGISNGLDSILDGAAELLKRKRADIKFLFIGEGKLKNALKERAKCENLTNCIFLDTMSKGDLNKIMSCADIGIMCLKNVPAFYYGTSPNKFFDYIASSLPVLNNYPGWLADMIESNNCGSVVKPDDPIAFANAMEYLANDPEKRELMGENGRKLAEKEFDRKKLGDQFVQFLEEVYEKMSK